MNKARVVSAFPGTGKSHLYREQHSMVVLDSDSSQYSWVYNSDGIKVRNPDFPNNYMTHIKEAMEQVDLILVSTHKEVRDALVANNISFDLVFPDSSLKDEYIQRYKDRGSDERFIKLMEDNFEKFIDELKNQEGCIKLVLDRPNIFLSDVRYSKEPVSFLVKTSLNSVICSGDIVDIGQVVRAGLQGYSVKPLPFMKGTTVEYVPNNTSDITTGQAIGHIIEQLKTDKSYYIGWQANITMAFKDCYDWSEDKQDIHQVANDAANHFLKTLMG
jgi:hypothetical protein